MGYIIVGIAALVGAVLCIWLYKANKKLAGGIERRRLCIEKLALDLRGITYFIEINATENYFPKEL